VNYLSSLGKKNNKIIIIIITLSEFRHEFIKTVLHASMKEVKKFVCCVALHANSQLWSRRTA